MLSLFFIFSACAYFLGSIPTAVWVGKIRFGVDVREHGSKNAGATNTFRVLGKKPGIFVLTVDVMKGAIATFLPAIVPTILEGEYLIQVQIFCAVFAVAGHVFPIFAGFKGGKGVATSLGVIIGLQPNAALICLGIFLLVFLLSKFVSLGAICAALVFPFVIKFWLGIDSIWLFCFSILLSALVIIAHRKNIKRLLRGEENKMNLFKK